MHTQKYGPDMATNEFRRLGHNLVEEIASILDNLHNLPVAPNKSQRTIQNLIKDKKLPQAGSDIEEITSSLAKMLSENTCLNAHPKMWGYITGCPSPIGALADLLAAAVNPNVGGWNGAPLATEIETQVVNWISELLGYSEKVSGILTSGGNMANFIGVLAARKAFADWDIRREGIYGHPLIIYATQETHAWIEKAADLFGFGTQAINFIETDAEQRMDPKILEVKIQRDKASGLKPFLVIGTAGTTSTGAIDPLPELAKICKKNDLWFHVDGCYGAPAILDTTAPDDLAGLQFADSLAVDGHKWLYVPLEAGCTLVKNSRHLTNAFSTNPSYYGHQLTDDAEDIINYHAMGPQNSRGFKALKFWMTLQYIGREGYREAISRNIAQASRMFERISQAPDFEAVTCNLSITTFRYVPEDLASITTKPDTKKYLNELNTALMTRIQQSGDLYISNAALNGMTLLRSCIVNFRTKDSDVDSVPELIRQHAEAIDLKMRRSL